MVSITPGVSVTARSPNANPKESPTTPTNIAIMPGVETLYFALHVEHLKRNGDSCFSAIRNVISALQFLHFIVIHQTNRFLYAVSMASTDTKRQGRIPGNRIGSAAHCNVAGAPALSPVEGSCSGLHFALESRSWKLRPHTTVSNSRLSGSADVLVRHSHTLSHERITGT